MTHHPTHLPRAAVVALAVLLATTLGACADAGSESTAGSPTTSAQAAYCGAWDDVVDAFAGFDDLDLVNDGLNSVEIYLEDLGDALKTFADAADAKLGPQIDGLKSAITGLGDAIGGDVDTDLGDAATDLRTSWDALVSALRQDCPDADGGS